MKVLVVISLMLLVLVGCGRARETVPKTQTITVRAREFRFRPVRIEVEKGTRVTVRLVNEGTKKHEWELPAYRTEIRPIAPGAAGEVTLVADKPGTFEFLCDVDDHDERGMKGFLVVK